MLQWGVTCPSARFRSVRGCARQLNLAIFLPTSPASVACTTILLKKVHCLLNSTKALLASPSLLTRRASRICVMSYPRRNSRPRSRSAAGTLDLVNVACTRTSNPLSPMPREHPILSACSLQRLPHLGTCSSLTTRRARSLLDRIRLPLGLPAPAPSYVENANKRCPRSVA